MNEIPKITLPSETAKKAKQTEVKRLITYLQFCLKDYIEPDLTRAEKQLILKALSNYEAMLLIENMEEN